jgi:TatD DNase family protein
MIELADTHCHIQSIGQKGGQQQTASLWSKVADLDQSLVIQRAEEAGVNRLIVVGCDLEDSQAALKCATKGSNIWASIGLHPHEADKYIDQKDKLAIFSRLIDDKKVVAVGECGLDYHYNHSTPAAQKEILKFQLDLAKKNNLPVIFHVREAFQDFWKILNDYKGIRGVLHSFTDDKHNLDEALKRGLFIGVNGIATFTKDPSQTEVYKAIPTHKLLFETDSPFLTPSPLRGKINEPKNVRLVAEYMADLRGQTLIDLASQTTLNARQLFRI